MKSYRLVWDLHNMSNEAGEQLLLEAARELKADVETPTEDWSIECAISQAGLELEVNPWGEALVYDPELVGFACHQCALILEGYPAEEIGIEELPDIGDDWESLGFYTELAGYCVICETLTDYASPYCGHAVRRLN